ncbi:MAG: DUF3854 domain-containing protein [Candidatus Ozemobacteraceae bacterium]
MNQKILAALLSDPNAADTQDKLAADDLLSSGLTPETIKTAGITLFQGDREKLVKLLGRSKTQGSELLQTGSLIVFPYRDRDGKESFSRVKPVPTVGDVKYLQPIGTPIKPYIPAPTWGVADKPSKPLWICEGEKKTLKVAQHGRYAIGLSGVWNFRNAAEPFLPDLREIKWTGRTVYLGYDTDAETNPAVRQALAELAVKLTSLGAIVHFPTWGSGKGIDDHLVTCTDADAELKTIETSSKTLLNYIEPKHYADWIRAVAVTMPSPIVEEQIVKTISEKLKVKVSTVERDIDARRDLTASEDKKISEIKILGSTPDGDILLYRAGKMLRVSTAKMSPGWLRVLTGTKSACKLKRLATDWQIDANKAGTFDPEKKIGPGIWKIKDSWVIVSGVEALIITGSEAVLTANPVYQGHVIEFDAADAWLDLATVKKSFAFGDLKSTFAETREITEQWRWGKKEMHEYATALAILSPFQRALRWRPNVAISGPSGCGKSLFADEFIGRLWGSLVVRSDRATAHSVAQSIGSTAKVLILDEFEKSKRIAEILDLLKLCGRGGYKTSGTGERASLRYEMRHLTWTLAAHLPAALKTDAAKANRTIKLSLNGGDGNPPVLPTDENYRDLASRLVGTVIKNWSTIEAHESYIDNRQAEIFAKLPGANHRVIDLFRSSSALLQAAIGGDWTIPLWGAEPLPTDGDMVLTEILTAMVPGQLGTTIEQMLQSETNVKELAAVGIKVAFHGGIKCLAIQPTQARGQLLSKTDFAEMDITEALERIPGAAKGKANFSAVSRLAVFVPFDLVDGTERQLRQLSGNDSGNWETLINKGLDSSSCRVADITPTKDGFQKESNELQQEVTENTFEIVHDNVGNSATIPGEPHGNRCLIVAAPVAASLSVAVPVAENDRTPAKDGEPRESGESRQESHPENTFEIVHDNVGNSATIPGEPHENQCLIVAAPVAASLSIAVPIAENDENCVRETEYDGSHGHSFLTKEKRRCRGHEKGIH